MTPARLSQSRESRRPRQVRPDVCVGRSATAPSISGETPAYVRGMRASAAGRAGRAPLVRSGCSRTVRRGLLPALGSAVP